MLRLCSGSADKPTAHCVAQGGYHQMDVGHLTVDTNGYPPNSDKSWSLASSGISLPVVVGYCYFMLEVDGESPGPPKPLVDH